jgi:ribosomal protein S18 acetylase RimI-like enzyme
MTDISYATITDLERILSIDVKTANSTERTGLIKSSVENRQCLIAKDSGSVAGFLIFNRSFFGNFFIGLVVVNQAFRQRGIGSALIKHFENGMKKNKIFTSTNRSNKAMQKLLVNSGYDESGIIYNLDEDDPEIIFFKQVE